VVLSGRVGHVEGQPRWKPEAAPTATDHLNAELRENGDRSRGRTILYPQMSPSCAIRVRPRRNDLSGEPGKGAVPSCRREPEAVKLAEGVRHTNTQSWGSADAAAAAAVYVHR